MHWLTWLVPWQPSPTVLLATLLAGWLYWRGCRATPVSVARQISFWTGLALLYAALHTRLDYYAEREFFMHRLQHAVLHHIGPFFVALAWPGPVLRAGIPSAWRERWTDPLQRSWPFRWSANFVMNPVVSGVLFVGLIWLWLIPDIHFYAMLDVRLYRLMNWGMAIDGLWFWLLTLDSRPSPPARLKASTRVLLLAAMVPPQMASGAFVTLATTNLYPLYELCGRAFSGITPLEDQTLGGLILWVPGTMMCILGALLELWFWFRNEEAAAPQPAAGAPVQ